MACRGSGSLRAGTRILLTAALLASAFIACNDNSNSNGGGGGASPLDCGLVRADLTGTWMVTFTADSANFTNCSDGLNHGSVTVTGGLITFTNVNAFASPSGTSFDAIGAGPNLSNELLASVEADSCLALVQVWENTSKAWLQCIGTLDRMSHTLSTFCDSAALDTTNPPDGQADVDCDLDKTLLAAVRTP